MTSIDWTKLDAYFGVVKDPVPSEDADTEPRPPTPPRVRLMRDPLFNKNLAEVDWSAAEIDYNRRMTEHQLTGDHLTDREWYEISMRTDGFVSTVKTNSQRGPSGRERREEPLQPPITPAPSYTDYALSQRPTGGEGPNGLTYHHLATVATPPEQVHAESLPARGRNFTAPQMHRAHTVQTFAVPNPEAFSLFRTPPERQSSDTDLTENLRRVQQQHEEDVTALGTNTGMIAGRVVEIESRVKTNLDKYYGALNNTTEFELYEAELKQYEADLKQYEAQRQIRKEQQQQQATAEPETTSPAESDNVRNRHESPPVASSPLDVPGPHRRTSSVYTDGIIDCYGSAAEEEEEAEEEVRVSHLSPRCRSSRSGSGEPIFRLSP